MSFFQFFVKTYILTPPGSKNQDLTVKLALKGPVFHLRLRTCSTYVNLIFSPYFFSSFHNIGVWTSLDPSNQYIQHFLTGLDLQRVSSIPQGRGPLGQQGFLRSTALILLLPNLLMGSQSKL